MGREGTCALPVLQMLICCDAARNLLPSAAPLQKPTLLQPPAAGPVGPGSFVLPGTSAVPAKPAKSFGRRTCAGACLQALSNWAARAWFQFLFLGLLGSAQKLEFNFSFPHKRKKLFPQEGRDHAESFAITALLYPPYRSVSQRQLRKTAFSQALPPPAPLPDSTMAFCTHFTPRQAQAGATVPVPSGAWRE